MPQFILALDQGTTSSRSILFDATGTPVAMAQREFTQHFPRSGWVEHDAEEIWATQAATITEVLVRARATPADVAAIGITNQRETTVLWDRGTGRPLAPAIVWQDRRTAALCRQLQADGLEPEVARRTGLLLDPYFSGTKLAWLLDHLPGARAAAERGELAFGTVDSWLLWRLTGGRVHASDASNAARTLLFDIHRDAWDDTLLQRLQIPAALLPAVHPSAHRYGETDAALFGAPIPITGVAGDQQAALFGQACWRPGLAKNTYGTGCFMLLATGAEARDSQVGLLTTRAAQAGATPQFALEGSVFIGGAVVQWLRDGLGAIRASGDVEALAASVSDSGGVCFVPAFAGLGAPYWDANARGAIVGLSRGSTVAHIARAALESIALQSTVLLQAMNADAARAGTQSVQELRVDGGACVNNLLMQLQADLLGIPVLRPRVVETTAWGAAALAGLGVGLYGGLDELESLWQVERRFEPGCSRDAAAERMARWEQAVRQARTV